MSKRVDPPTVLADCEVGAIVRTRDGVVWVTAMLNGRPLVRFVDADTMTSLSEPFFTRGDLEVLEVLRDQTFYRMHPRAGGREVDPLKGK